jgi:signal transduction histidine kinase
LEEPWSVHVMAAIGELGLIVGGFMLAAAGSVGAALGWWLARRRARPPGDADEALARATPDASLPPLSPLTEQTPWAVADRWMATVSHELRTPLQATLSWAQITKNAAGDAERTRQSAERILQAVRTQSLLLDELQDNTRILGAALVPAWAPADVHELLQQVAEAARSAAAARGVTVDSVGEPNALPMHTDARRLQQLLASLLGNAVQASADGGVVRLGYRLVGGSLWVEVSDQGRGIDPLRLPHIFEPLLPPLAGARSQRGRGVGLAVARCIAEALGGELTAHSDGLGQGACFTLRLPAQAVATGHP